MIARCAALLAGVMPSPVVQRNDVEKDDNRRTRESFQPQKASAKGASGMRQWVELRLNSQRA